MQPFPGPEEQTNPLFFFSPGGKGSDFSSLGNNIAEDLTWTNYTTVIVKKAQKQEAEADGVLLLLLQ